jgi:hypothetical protein
MEAWIKDAEELKHIGLPRSHIQHIIHHRQDILMMEIHVNSALNTLPHDDQQEASVLSPAGYKQMSLKDLLHYVYEVIDHQACEKHTGLNHPSELAVSAQDRYRYYMSRANALKFRDLRSLDYESHLNLDPSILIRRHVIVMILDPIRALIMKDRLIFIVPPGADMMLLSIDQHMRQWFIDDQLPAFEIYAYEALLIHGFASHEDFYRQLSQQISERLGYFQKGLLFPYEEQQMMRQEKNYLIKLLQQITSQRDYLSELMDDEEALAYMNLSLIAAISISAADVDNDVYEHLSMDRDEHRKLWSAHEEVQELFEVYLADYNAMIAKMQHLLERIDSSEDLISLKLNTSENEILIAQWSVTAFTCSIAFSAYIANIFGMNLDQAAGYVTDIQDPKQKYNSGLFMMVFIVTMVTVLLIYYPMRYYLQKIGILPDNRYDPKMLVWDLTRAILQLVEIAMNRLVRVRNPCR